MAREVPEFLRNGKGFCKVLGMMIEGENRRKNLVLRCGELDITIKSVKILLDWIKRSILA